MDNNLIDPENLDEKDKKMLETFFENSMRPNHSEEQRAAVKLWKINRAKARKKYPGLADYFDLLEAENPEK